MVYLAEITIPANTPESTPVKLLLDVNKGLVWRIEVEFPGGCCGLVHVQIFDALYQVFPATPGTSLRGDAVTVGYDDLYLKDSAPYDFTIACWNEDDLYEHKIQVRLCMATTEAFMARYLPSITWEKFQETLAKAAMQQEAEKEAAIAKLQLQAITEESGEGEA